MKRFCVFILLISIFLSFGNFTKDENYIRAAEWEKHTISFLTGAAGTGTEANPYILTSGEHLAYLAYATFNGNSFAGKFLKLGNSIDMSAYTWSLPIGQYSKDFCGNFNGNFCIIKNLKNTNASSEYESFGLFGRINGATIKNLFLEQVEYSNLRSTFNGGLVGIAHASKIHNVVIKNSTLKTYSGQTTSFLVSQAYGNTEISKCALINSYSETTLVTRAGGLVALQNGGVISESFVLDGKYLAGAAEFGGIAGGSTGVIANCFTDIDMDASNANSGTLIGFSGGTPQKLFSVNGVGIGNGSKDGCTNGALNAIPLGWDSNIWGISSDINQASVSGNYLFLKWYYW